MVSPVVFSHCPGLRTIKENGFNEILENSLESFSLLDKLDCQILLSLLHVSKRSSDFRILKSFSELFI